MTPLRSKVRIGVGAFAGFAGLIGLALQPGNPWTDGALVLGGVVAIIDALRARSRSPNA